MSIMQCFFILVNDFISSCRESKVGNDDTSSSTKAKTQAKTETNSKNDTKQLEVEALNTTDLHTKAILGEWTPVPHLLHQLSSEDVTEAEKLQLVQDAVVRSLILVHHQVLNFQRLSNGLVSPFPPFSVHVWRLESYPSALRFVQDS
jgi:hypothetical protein